MKRLAIVYDVRNWCWGHQAKAIKKYAPADVECDIMDQSEWGKSEEKHKYDAMLHFSWTSMPAPSDVRMVSVLAHHGAMFEPWKDLPDRFSYEGEDWPAVAATPKRNAGWFKEKAKQASGLICVNSSLHVFCQAMGVNSEFIPAGVDTEIYRPIPLQGEPNEKLVVGWCGQAVPSSPNTKGFDWVLIPLIQKLGESVSWKINGRSHQSALSQGRMVEWYNSIDIIACTSISEGSPATTLEAMACGKPVVSTAVGDMIDFPAISEGDEGESFWIAPKYQNQHQAQKTISLLDNDIRVLSHLKKHQKLPASSRDFIVKHRNWKTLAPKWIDYALGR